MKLTIAICTYNRHLHLRSCLRALAELGYADVHEVIVVDNSDSPEARQANERAASALPARYLVSEPPGLSRARNLALESATGDVVAFVDDDAVCVAGWAEAVIHAFAQPDVVCVGGPTQPRWEAPPPAWLSGELLHAIGVLDLGQEARALGPDEFFIGANIAFRRRALQAVGGFAVDLGRTKGDLMGDEEVEIQNRLRPFGRLWYAPAARVMHSIQQERMTFEWFLKRYAWQGVSDARSNMAGMIACLGEALEKTAGPELRPALEKIFGAPPTTADDATRRLQLARALVAALLNSDIPAPGRTRHAAPSLADPEFEPFRLRVPGDTRVLFIEFGTSHAYLYGAYGGLPGACLVNLALDPARQMRECAAFLRNALFFASRTGIEWVGLLTADVLGWGPWDEALANRPAGVKVFGFVHRPPADAPASERFARTAGNLDRILVFSTALRSFLRDQLRLPNVATVPHPPIFFGNASPRARRRPAQDALVTLGLLGEVRPEKGYVEAVSELASAPRPLRSRLRLTMAGGTSGGDESRLASLCAMAGITSALHLRPRNEASYRAIPDNLFAQAIAGTDVMAFPFAPDHWYVFSGHFVDALVAGAWFVATRGTVLGDLVEKYGLGDTFEHGRPGGLCHALESVLERMRRTEHDDAGRARLLAEHTVAAACRAVEDVLGETPEVGAERRLPKSASMSASPSV